LVKPSSLRLLITVLASVLCASDASTQSAAVDLSRTAVSFEERTPSCIGCPDLRVTFRGAGAAEFECLGSCTVPGRQLIKFPKEQFANLIAALEAARFFGLPRVVGGCTDCGIVTVTYRDQRRIHEVVDRGFAKIPVLKELQARLRETAKPFDLYAKPTRANYAALLEAGWNPNQDLDDQDGTMLNYAVAGGEPAAIELLLSRGAVVNRRALETLTSPDALALLWNAARVRPASEQAHALMWLAARDNRVAIIEWLVAKGVEVDAPQPGTGITPLMIAARGGQKSFDALLRHRARTDLRDASGNQLLWYAAEADHNTGSLARVLALGAQIDAVNDAGRTPLMHAAESCALMNVRALLAAGASPAHRDKTGKTASDLVPQGRGDYEAGVCGRVRSVLAR
jgi:hypothetical protein